MKTRIATDKNEYPETGFYWVEEFVNGEWVYVFGTLNQDAGKAWDNYEAMRKANVQPTSR
jgi:hypothetical protein